MNYILFDGAARNNLLPFTFTRPVADIRIGILTIREKWEKYLGNTTTTITEDYLSEKYTIVEMEDNVLINASFLPTKKLADLIADLKENEAIFQGEEIIAFFTKESQEEVDFSSYKAIDFKEDILRLVNTWDIFEKNGSALEADFELITAGRKSAPISKSNTLICPDRIFAEPGAIVEHSILNAKDGPIYLLSLIHISEPTRRTPISYA